MHSVYVTLRAGCGPIRGVQSTMRLLALMFTATLIAAPLEAQPPSPSTLPDESTKEQAAATLPVSLAKIREALSTTPPLSLSTVDERPTFRIQIQERQKLEELLATLNFKAGIMFPSVDNPLRQQFGAFSQSELLTILIENVIGKHLGGKAMNAISKSERASAEAAARDEVRSAIAQYCGSRPGAGAGIQICDTPVR